MALTDCCLWHKTDGHREETCRDIDYCSWKIRKTRVDKRIAVIQNNPRSYAAMCNVASLRNEMEAGMARLMMENADRLVFKRDGVVVSAKPSEWAGDGLQWEIPGEYRDYVTIHLDGVKLLSRSCLRTVSVSKRGIY
jgi:hypothetical protein